MSFRIPGHEPKEYPEDDKEKVNVMMSYLAANRSSPVLIDTIVQDLGWELDEIDELILQEMLMDSGRVSISDRVIVIENDMPFITATNSKRKIKWRLREGKILNPEIFLEVIDKVEAYLKINWQDPRFNRKRYK